MRQNGIESTRSESCGAAERFQMSLLAPLRALVTKVIEAEENQSVFDRNPIEKLFVQVFAYWSEIHACRNSLGLVLKLVGRPPDKRLKTTHSEYLRFCIESYFAEVYRLQERLATCGTKLSRKYGIDKRWTNDLIKLVREILQDLTTARSKFVHESRFDDPRILEAEGLELLSSHPEIVGDSALYIKIATRRLRAVRNQWTERLEKSNVRIDELLDLFFFFLDGIVFDENGKLKAPNS